MEYHLGCEVEFWSDEHTAMPALREYYPDQWEVNDFHEHSEDVKEVTPLLYKWADAILDRSSKGRLDFSKAVLGAGGPVFSGVHIHLQLVGHDLIDEDYSVEGKKDVARDLSNIVIATVLEHFGVSCRLMFSHHIHGSTRSSRYNFKRKARFAPVVFHSGFETYELRCIEPEMLYTAKGREALEVIIDRCFAYLRRETVDIPSKYSSLCSSLRLLNGDVKTSEDVVQYQHMVRRLTNSGVKVRFTMETPENHYVNVRWQGITAKEKRILLATRTVSMSVEDCSEGGDRIISYIKFRDLVENHLMHAYHFNLEDVGGRDVLTACETVNMSSARRGHTPLSPELVRSRADKICRFISRRLREEVENPEPEEAPRGRGSLESLLAGQTTSGWTVSTEPISPEDAPPQQSTYIEALGAILTPEQLVSIRSRPRHPRGVTPVSREEEENQGEDSNEPSVGW